MIIRAIDNFLPDNEFDNVLSYCKKSTYVYGETDNEIEEENDVKLLIYDCGIVSSSNNLDFNKEVLKNTFNRRNFIKILDTIKRMRAYLLRHEEDLEKSKSFSDGCGYLMYQAWGGRAGLVWATSKHLVAISNISLIYLLFKFFKKNNA